MDMNNMTLPLPNPTDWISVGGAAAQLFCSTRTIRRMIKVGALTGYRPVGAPAERATLMLWRGEVEAAAAAQKTLKVGTLGRG